MSKFVELLNKVGLQSHTPMGFGEDATSGRQPTPEIVLVARILPSSVVKIPNLADSEADAYSLGADLMDKKAIDSTAKALKDQVWGMRDFGQLSLASGQELAKKGCDFVVLTSWDTEACLLNEEDLGLIGTVRVTTTEKEGRYYGVPAMEEHAIHALSALTHGLVLMPALRDLPLSVETAVDIQRILSVVDKPFIVEAPEGIGSGDIELLRNMGVAGIFVDLDGPEDLERISEVKKAIDALPRRRERRENRDALLPQSPAPEQGGVPDTTEDDFDDDDY